MKTHKSYLLFMTEKIRTSIKVLRTHQIFIRGVLFFGEVTPRAFLNLSIFYAFIKSLIVKGATETKTNLCEKQLELNEK